MKTWMCLPVFTSTRCPSRWQGSDVLAGFSAACLASNSSHSHNCSGAGRDFPSSKGQERERSSWLDARATWASQALFLLEDGADSSSWDREPLPTASVFRRSAPTHESLEWSLSVTKASSCPSDWLRGGHPAIFVSRRIVTATQGLCQSECPHGARFAPRRQESWKFHLGRHWMFQKSKTGNCRESPPGPRPTHRKISPQKQTIRFSPSKTLASSGFIKFPFKLLEKKNTSKCENLLYAPSHYVFLTHSCASHNPEIKERNLSNTCFYFFLF
nr:uncharacterized protein LOC131762682 [Kogia breviceps]